MYFICCWRCCNCYFWDLTLLKTILSYDFWMNLCVVFCAYNFSPSKNYSVLFCIYCVLIKLGEIHMSQKKKPTMYIVYSQRIIWIGGIILEDTLHCKEVTVLNITCQNLNYDPRDYYKEEIYVYMEVNDWFKMLQQKHVWFQHVSTSK